MNDNKKIDQWWAASDMELSTTKQIGEKNCSGRQNWQWRIAGED